MMVGFSELSPGAKRIEMGSCPSARVINVGPPTIISRPVKGLMTFFCPDDICVKNKILFKGWDPAGGLDGISPS
jgi:hypothetical protein